MNHKAMPEGFTIGFSRHGKQRWGWKEEYSHPAATAAGRPSKRTGFPSRSAALRDLEAEIALRKELLEQKAS